jgi:hypothetical protein
VSRAKLVVRDAPQALAFFLDRIVLRALRFGAYLESEAHGEKHDKNYE